MLLIIIITIIISLLFIYYLFYKSGLLPRFWFNNIHDKHLLISTKPASQILAYYTMGYDLLPLHNGYINNLFYSVMLTVTHKNNDSPSYSVPNTIIYSLDLPFMSNAHIVGISKKWQSSLPHFAEYVIGSGFQKISLEGDFDNYFSLYAPESQQTQVRYVFDPAAMEYVVDYCQNYFWEIYNDTIYFAIEPNNKDADVINNSIDFIKQIKPAIIKQFPNAKSREMHYKKSTQNEAIGSAFLCPICKTKMKLTQYWQGCQKGHGRLLQAKTLSMLRNQKINQDKNLLENVSINGIKNRTDQIICPNCKDKMAPVNYAMSGIIIDSCQNSKCLYRWLDTGELSKILK
ncbi:zf-TFIIB domain-containing protein [Candidatus Saccharibacteria bacterium]|nr:zf-TFIIB domain-containing protein [Candidatus Saccharibacteria bacterium]MDQ5885290.1 hypothetical protein [Patescibacteria group bacterium]